MKRLKLSILVIIIKVTTSIHPSTTQEDNNATQQNIPVAKAYLELQINAHDYPELEKGFELIGRPLQPFIDQKLQILYLDPQSDIHNNETVHHNIIQAVQMKISTILSENRLKESLNYYLEYGIIYNDSYVTIHDPFVQYHKAIIDPVIQFCITSDYMKPVMSQFMSQHISSIKTDENGREFYESGSFPHSYLLGNSKKLARYLIALQVNKKVLMTTAIKVDADQVVEELVHAGVNVNNENYLHQAVQAQSKKSILALHATGANLLQENSENKIAYDYARSDSIRNLLKYKEHQTTAKITEIPDLRGLPITINIGPFHSTHKPVVDDKCKCLIS